MTVLLGLPPVADLPGAGWVTEEAVAAILGDGTAFTAADVADLTAMLLYALTGSQYGSATDTVRPYRAAGGCGCAGELVTFSWSSMPRIVCGCSGPSFVILPGPVTAIDSVTVDGVELAAADDWRLVDGHFLVRVGASWPCCQDLTVPSTEPGTWAITYTHGPGIPAGGAAVALMLATEIAKAARGDSDCALSGRVQSVTRDGVSAVLVFDPSVLAEGGTGIPIVDLWVDAVAPNGRNRGGTLSLPGHLRGLLTDDQPAVGP